MVFTSFIIVLGSLILQTLAQACSQGKCVVCSLGMYSLGSMAACASCLTSSIASCSPQDGTALSCVAGYGLSSSGTCSICPATTWSDGKSPCSNCIVSNSASCSPTSGKVTSCNAGYGLIGNACFPCNAGTYALAGSTSTCTSCSPGQFSGATASQCYLCSPDTYAATSGSTFCQPCGLGQIASSGATTCGSCPSSTWKSGQNTCTSCMGSPGIASCGPNYNTANSCNAGYQLISGSCSGCSSGSYSIGGTSTACSPCLANQYSVALAGFCSPCLGTGYAGCGPFNNNPTSCISGYGLNLVSGTCTLCTGGLTSSGLVPCH